jgi:hypothetical protein
MFNISNLHCRVFSYQSQTTFGIQTYLSEEVKLSDAKIILQSWSVEQLNLYLCSMERVFFKTPAYVKFYSSLNARAQKKVKYILEHIRDERNISTKFVKHLVNTDFYEMRISVDNEYRVILFAVDNKNIINANEIFLLNGFIKKSTADYDKQIAIAQKILEEHL